MFKNLCNSDKGMVCSYYNTNILPGLYRLGVLPDGLTYEYVTEENIPELWGRAKDAMQYMQVDPVWITEKFGVKVLGPKQDAGGTGFFG
jgi:hypothetical protein